ncbi:hypothetical protein BV25DRAFT_1890790 [Artomyces pyxidatus]|uniref:Uncharacterized protein n=1 Tax=Artomyces pyxidatus TaxID=48021 RepID=A0ACB8SRM1_9AGAM|nr:hypothetical protein BV25DRAFT_1890790 [Artomyces pyxidatus]
MRISLLPLLVAGAGLAAANPLSVMISTTDVSAIRFGHPAAAAPSAQLATAQPTRMRHLCKTMKDSVSRVIAAMGLAKEVDANSHGRIIVHEYRPVMVSSGNGMGRTHETAEHPEGVEHFRGRHHLKGMHRGPFITRMHRALMSLGPWEGRMVAFVLGCGIGVLIRMFYVLSVLLFRAIRGNNQESDTEDVEYTIVFADAEEYVLPPPEYTDEKVAAAAMEDPVQVPAQV